MDDDDGVNDGVIGWWRECDDLMWDEKNKKTNRYKLAHESSLIIARVEDNNLK